MYTTWWTEAVISGQHFFWISIGCAVLGFIFLSLTCQLTTERVRVERKESMPVSVLLKGLARNKALIVLVVVDLLIVINQGLSGTNMTYLFNDYFHNKEAMSVALLFTFGSWFCWHHRHPGSQSGLVKKRPASARYSLQ